MNQNIHVYLLLSSKLYLQGYFLDLTDVYYLPGMIKSVKLMLKANIPTACITLLKTFYHSVQKVNVFVATKETCFKIQSE